jgi:hypothetical protein
MQLQRIEVDPVQQANALLSVGRGCGSRTGSHDTEHGKRSYSQYF